MLVSAVLPHGGPGVGSGQSSGLWSNPFPQLQCEGGCQHGGAGDPGVLQGQGEAGGVSRRVSAGLGEPGGGGVAQGSPLALHYHLFLPPLPQPQGRLSGAAICSHAPQAP